MPFVEAKDGTRLFYHDWGTGAPVVFVHGWALGADMWEYQTTYLAGRGVRCIAYDRRGCGRSDQPWSGYDYDTLADDLGVLIEELDLREVTLVGYSLGSGDVVRYLSRHGAGRIARAAFVAPTTPFLLKTAENPDGVDKSYFDELIADLYRDRPRYLAAGAEPFFGVGLPNISVSPEIVQWGVGLALRASLRASIEMQRFSSETDFRAEMRALRIPALVIHGDSDQNVPIALSGQRTAELIQGSRFQVYEGAAHGLFFTHKDRLNADLLAFARS